MLLLIADNLVSIISAETKRCSKALKEYRKMLLGVSHLYAIKNLFHCDVIATWQFVDLFTHYIIFKLLILNINISTFLLAAPK